MLSVQDQGFLYGDFFLKEMPPLHPVVRAPFVALREKAVAAGIELQIASGQRDFERQMAIWNRKATGELPVLDSQGHPLDISRLSGRETVMAILRWSSLPGASRHHWGTDMDVFDARVLPTGYAVQLTTEEAYGLFGHLHQWLDEQIATDNACGFFRPYTADRGGIAPEPWHLSYAPLAKQFQQAFSLEELVNRLTQSNIALKADILASAEEIYQRFIFIPDEAYPNIIFDERQRSLPDMK